MEQENRTITVFVATHKKLDIDFPEGYIPMQVNCANTGSHWPKYYHDDYGENISEKNPYYCELTVLYSAWKNCNSNIKGLVHYRRYMANKTVVEFYDRQLCDIEKLEDEIIGSIDIERLINEEHNDILLTIPYGPYPKNGREELEEFCYSKDVDILINVIKNYFPDYNDALERILLSTNLFYYNMMIARSEVFDNYAEWLFDVLGKIEEKCDVSEYDVQHKRLYGYLAEFLLNVYFEKNRDVKKRFVGIVYPYQFMDGTHALYDQQKKRSKQYSWLRKMRLDWLAELMWKIKHPVQFKAYQVCKEYVNK